VSCSINAQAFAPYAERKDPPEADKLRQRRTSYARGTQVTPETHKSARGGPKAATYNYIQNPAEAGKTAEGGTYPLLHTEDFAWNTPPHTGMEKFLHGY